MNRHPKSPSAPLRVAYVSLDHDHPLPSPEPGTWDPVAVLQGLRRLGHHVELFRPGNETTFRPLPPGLRHHALTSTVDGPPFRRAEDGIGLNPSLVRELERAQCPRPFPEPQVPSFQLLYERHSVWSYAGLEWAQRHGVPAVLEIHGPLTVATEDPVHALAADVVTRRAFAAATTLLAPSRPIAEWAAQRGVAPSRIQLVAGAVDPEPFVRLPIPGTWPLSAADPVLVGVVGSVLSENALRVALAGIQRSRTLTPIHGVLVVANASEYARVRRAAADLDMQDLVEWTDRSDTARVIKALSRTRIVLLAEGSGAGQPLIEAMAAGRPIIAGCSNPASQLLNHARTAWLVDSSSASGIAAALGVLLRCPRLLAHLGSNSRELALRDHSWPAILQRLLASIGAPRQTPAVHQPQLAA